MMNLKLWYANKGRSMLPFGNFGDDLNAFLWPKVFPNLFCENATATFLGIGTILHNRMPRFPKTIVFGSGAGFYPPPEIDNTWKIYFVRGPLTARSLGVAGKEIVDPGILIPLYWPTGAKKKFRYAYMMHVFEYESTELFQSVCNRLGIHFIDPRRPVDDVIADIDRTEILITSAMHGAIAADSLRVPWVYLKTNAGLPDFKWLDWCQSMEVEFDPVVIKKGSRLKKLWKPLGRIEERLIHLGIAKAVRKSEPRLSTGALLSLRTRQLVEQIDLLKNDAGCEA